MAERPHLLIMFRRIFFDKNTEEHLKAEVEFFNDKEVSRHPNFVKHVSDDLMPRYKEWSMSERIENEMPTTHGNHTTNYVETSFGKTKNNILNRTKAFNLCNTLDVVLYNSIPQILFSKSQ